MNISLSIPTEREFSKIDLFPGVDAPSNVFNLFKGFPIKPKGGISKIPYFHELLLDVICSVNEKWADYFWGWLAHMIQKLMEKPVAIALMSNAQGVGKADLQNMLGACLAGIL